MTELHKLPVGTMVNAFDKTGQAKETLKVVGHSVDGNFSILRPTEKELQSALRKQLKEEVGDQEFPKDNKRAQAQFQILRQKFGIIPPRYTESEREMINAG